MNSSRATDDFVWTPEIWQSAEKLASPINAEREKALNYLTDQGAPQKSPLIAYLMVTMISEPELETRFHAIQALGSIIVNDSESDFCDGRVLEYIQAYLARINRDQILDLLAVAVQYLSAEQSLIELFKLCSYAGDILNGIVNDRKLPVQVRRSALFYCGEVGFMDTITTIQGLISRVEKREKVSSKAAKRKRIRDENDLYSFAVIALEKLES
jgi:hypothetical protein